MELLQQIKRAAVAACWGDLWELVENKADEDGWVVWNYMPFYKGDESELPEGFEETSGAVFIRPKSLSGIESNNDWVRIFSDADLPPRSDDNYEVGFMDASGHFSRQEVPKSYFSVVNLYHHHRITHYRLLPQSPNPVF